MPTASTNFDPISIATFIALVVTFVLLLSARRTVRQQRDSISLLREEIAALRPQVEQAEKLREELNDTRKKLDEQVREAASLQSRLTTLTQSHEARLEEIRSLKKELEEKFSTLASGVLKSNSETFLELVSERFEQHRKEAEQDLTTRQNAIKELVKPLDEKLGQFSQRINEIEQARNEAYGAIKAQVAELARGQKSLDQETRKLVQALRAPKTRGRWGEMQLRQVFEMAGMTQNVDFLLESTVDTDNGRQRPDAIVKIPGGKSIVVDAKTPLQAFLDAIEAETPEEQRENLARHAQQVRNHVKLLSSKDYQDAIPGTPDFVVMFIPGETFVSAAVEADPELLEDAFQRKVLIATPTTLMALIKAIAYGWQQEKLAENAAEVQALAKDLYNRLGVFAEHLEKVGQSIGKSVENYNKAIGSLEGRILPAARKFENMGVVATGSELRSPSSVDKEPRRLTASEFTQIENTPKAGDL